MQANSKAQHSKQRKNEVDQYEGLSPDTVEGRLTAEMLDAAGELKAMWTEMLVEVSKVSDIDQGNVKNETTSPLFSERD